ncbi:hypothetical protein HK096_008186 [Nowakowskiella sp. JEL0078]|nr:hypothetical protein HK096_008186 [Nowakowskiella sp. JEL0078]
MDVTHSHPRVMEDTEWNDLLVQHGILKKDVEITEDDLAAMVDTAVAEKYEKVLASKTVDDLDEMLDDLLNEPDERELESYRRARLAQLKDYASRAIFGSVSEISKPDYAVEVADASKTSWVVLTMYQSHIPASKLLLQHIEVLAKRHPTVKFVKIVADRCVEGYPDENVPTVLVYALGELKRQVIGLNDITGKKSAAGSGAWDIACSVEDVEKFLLNVGAFELLPDEFAGGKNLMKKKGDDDDDDDDDDEEETAVRSRFNIRRI